MGCILRNHGMYFAQPWDVFCETMGCILRNHGMYFAKPWDVFCETMGCILQNHGIYLGEVGEQCLEVLLERRVRIHNCSSKGKTKIKRIKNAFPLLTKLSAHN